MTSANTTLNNHTSDISEYDILFDFWDEIPMVELIPKELYHYIDDHNYREAIVVVLRVGVFDEQRQRQRYALTMKEVQHEVKKFLGKDKIPKSTLYHHRDMLLEAGFIKEVATILEGKRHVTYYGRSAKAFIGKTHNPEDNKKFNNQVKKIIQTLIPDKEIENLDEYLNKTGELSNQRHERIIRWMEDHENLINRNDLDVIVLYKLLDRCMKRNELEIEFNETLSNHLKIE